MDNYPLLSHKRQKVTNFDAFFKPPDDTNVHHYITNLSNMIVNEPEEQWITFLDRLGNPIPTSNPNSYSNNGFLTSFELPKESTKQNVYGLPNLNQQQMWNANHNPISLRSDNFNSSVNMGYSGYSSGPVNISNSQYFGRPLIKNVAGTYVSSDGMNLISPSNVRQSGISDTKAFGRKIVQPVSVMDFNSTGNLVQQQQFHQGQYRSPIGQKQIAYNMGIPTVMNNLQSTSASQCNLYNPDVIYNPQISNCETFSRPWVQMPALSKPNQWADQFSVQSEKQWKDQSNAYKNDCLNSWKQVPGELPVAEKSSDCGGLNCYICNSAILSMGSKKRKNSSMDGTLMDVLTSFLEGRCSPKTPVSLSYQHLPVDLPPPLVQWSDNSIQSENVSEVTSKSLTMGSVPDVTSIFTGHITGDYQITKGSQTNSVVTSEECNAQSKCGVEEKTSLGKEESGQGVVEVSCELNTASDDFEMVLESEKPETQTTSGDDNGSGSGSGNIKNLSEECKEQSECGIEEKMSLGKEESGQVVAEVSCELNTASVDFEMVLESEKPETQTTSGGDNVSGSGLDNIRNLSASLADSFTASQIKEHLSSFIQHDKDNLENKVPTVSHDPCHLCSKDKLMLAPTPIYCSCCELRVKQNAAYHRSSDEQNTNTQHSVCLDCFKKSRGDTILIRGVSVSKENLQKEKNDEEREDSWVQCDGCQLWQHRICGLYNNERDTEGKEEYICPKCRLKEIEHGKGVQLPQAVLGAKNLPRTNLSDHIEQRLFRRLKQEREETAKFHGIEPENVLEAEGLVVRVVASVDKETLVKQEFRDIFNGEYYPEKLPYRSKLILLFQNKGGVDLCLFGMYVEEYGSECEGPNNRCLHISYLDSVKYFEPERKTAGGESLRTFVYHEILIGYLEYCKRRGFASCYIWACPPKADDYIFYCHPDTQKTPQQDKLRQWYKSMLKKAAEDGIVVDQTNLYNEFFLPTNQGNTKISAARLPYFDGAYWSFAAENVSKELEEERSGGICSKSPSKKFLMTMGQENPTKDALVMHILRKSIVRWKGNFIIARLHYPCTYCHEVMLCGSRWSCNQCNNLHLCSRCFDDGKLLPPSRVHTCHPSKTSPLSEGSYILRKHQTDWNVLSDVPLDTKDKDDVLVNNFFEARSDFLNKCQISQYQFNTLNNAKYSSMMILYHFLSNLVIQPTSAEKLTNPSTEATNERKTSVEKLTNPSTEVVTEPKTSTEKLTNPSTEVATEPKTSTEKLTNPSIEVATEFRIEQPLSQQIPTLKDDLDPVVHATRCKTIQCPYPSCQAIRDIFYHCAICTVQFPGCQACRRAWEMYMMHIKDCTDFNCKVPRCLDTRKQQATPAFNFEKRNNFQQIKSRQ